MYININGQTAGLSCCHLPGAHYRIYITVVLLMLTPSVTRIRISSLQLLLGLASAVILKYEFQTADDKIFIP
jgi:hypothetical protein